MCNSPRPPTSRRAGDAIPARPGDQLEASFGQQPIDRVLTARDLFHGSHNVPNLGGRRRSMGVKVAAWANWSVEVIRLPSIL
jgi:hypothetical protein